MTDILLFIWCLIITAWLGRLAIRALRITSLTGMEEAVISLGFGFGILSYATFLLGIFGLLYRSLFWGAFLALSVAFLIKDGRKVLLYFRNINLGWIHDYFLLKLTLLVFAGLTLIGSLAPATFWDVVVYHLTMPQLYIRHHRIINVWHIVQSNLPYFMEMLYTLGMILKGEVLAALFHFSMGILTGLAIYSFGKRFLSKEIGLFACAIFYASPLQVCLASAAYNDLSLAFFVFVAVYLFLLWLKEPGDPLLIGCAIFAGISAAIKYFGLMVIFMIGLGIIIRILRERKLFKPLSIFLGISVLIAFPWYLKNWIYTGDPLFPLFHRIFKLSSSLSPENLRVIMYQFQVEKSLKGIKDYLLYPFSMVFDLSRFAGWRWTPGPLYLIGITLLLFQREINRTVKYLLVFGMVFLSIALLMQLTSPRHLAFIFALLSIPASYGLVTLSQKDGFIKKILFSVFSAVMAVNLVFALALNFVRIPFVLGQETKEAYLERRVDSYPAIRYINQNLSADSRTLTYDPRVYYFQKEFILGNPLYNPFLDYSAMAGPEDLISWMKKENITHVLVNYPLEAQELSLIGTSYFHEPVKKVRDAIKERHLRLIYQDNDVCLYRMIY